LLPDDARRVLRETLPRLPDEFGGITGKELSEWLAWGAIGIELPPQPKLRVHVQTTSNDAAQSLEKLFANAWQAAPKRGLREQIPDADALIPLLLPKASGDKVVLSIGEKPGDLDKITPLVVAALQTARSAATRSQTVNNLKQFALAMHNYHDANKGFPAAASYNKDGKPLLSWRVHVLPYVDGGDLYKEFHLDEPWDSEHNKKLIEKMPKIYEDPRVPAEKGKTTFVVPIGEKTIFGGREGMKIQKITDGTSNTILVVEADAKHAVIWTKPDDLQIDPKDPAAGLFADERKQILAAFADGSVHVLALPKIADQLPALFSATGGEVVTLP